MLGPTVRGHAWRELLRPAEQSRHKQPLTSSDAHQCLQGGQLAQAGRQVAVVGQLQPGEGCQAGEARVAVARDEVAADIQQRQARQVHQLQGVSRQRSCVRLIGNCQLDSPMYRSPTVSEHCSVSMLNANQGTRCNTTSAR